ncbi:MAG: transposase [Planctomycetes bacterium]|nr:transposase [Planctomycetota bacterium]
MLEEVPVTTEGSTRRRFSPEQKVAILRQHLIEKVPVSALCDQHGLRPNQFYPPQADRRAVRERHGGLRAGSGATPKENRNVRTIRERLRGRTAAQTGQARDRRARVRTAVQLRKRAGQPALLPRQRVPRHGDESRQLVERSRTPRQPAGGLD